MVSKATLCLLILSLIASAICCSRTTRQDTSPREEMTSGKDIQSSETILPPVKQEEAVSPRGGTPEYYAAQLESEEKEARLEAVQKLREMGAKAGNAVDALIKTLRFDKDKDIRSGAADALSAIGEKAKSSIPILIFALRDEAWEVRMHVAKALGSFKADAKDALNALGNALQNEKVEEVRKEIEAAINAISEE